MLHCSPAHTAAYPLRLNNKITNLISTAVIYDSVYQDIMAAKRSVYVLVSFFDSSFCFPNGKNIWDVIRELTLNGLEVKILFWRNTAFSMSGQKRRDVFSGDNDDILLLKNLNINVEVRWDKSPDTKHCHHEKTWLIDAGLDTAKAYILSVTLGIHHYNLDGPHEVGMKIEGNLVGDIHHHFVMRWNNCVLLDDNDPACFPLGNSDMDFPSDVPTVSDGDCLAQFIRDIPAGHYRLNKVSPGYEARFSNLSFL
eukprot:TRINITY_DN3544_c0_g1_i4.p1 TRINITY_DN3544_c0_g1~~TRINITY_DN3544_c0_g1_i4.p1  ORF type:complete len:253 (-),score=40.21 TRINITY_DN3544_c0_g1_i4:845-1603(-)